MKKILIWGTGDRANAYIKAGYFKDCMIKGFIDTYGSAGTYQGYDVYRPAELARVYESIDYIVIANEFYEEILQQCEILGIGAETAERSTWKTIFGSGHLNWSQNRSNRVVCLVILQSLVYLEGHLPH